MRREMRDRADRGGAEHALRHQQDKIDRALHLGGEAGPDLGGGRASVVMEGDSLASDHREPRAVDIDYCYSQSACGQPRRQKTTHGPCADNRNSRDHNPVPYAYA